MNAALLTEETQVGGAEFSTDRRYRYRLWRLVQPKLAGRVGFVMLNPSTADGIENDRTISRCMAYARSWGYGRMEVVNLYAWRATKPRDMWAAAERGEHIVGPANHRAHVEFFARCDMIVCAWGAKPAAAAPTFLKTFAGFGFDLHALELTKDGRPKHPLYLRADLTPFLWQPKDLG